MFGPPEKVWTDKVETVIPGVVLAEYGKGRMAYVPWDVGGLYYRHGSPGHAGLMSDLIDHLLTDQLPTANLQLPPKELSADRLRVLWGVEVGSW